MSDLGPRNGQPAGSRSLGRHSLLWKLVVPVPLVLVLTLAISWYWVPRQVAHNAELSARAHAASTIAQYQMIRSYYTQSVVQKVLENSNIEVSENHRDEVASIPLPATFIHDMSDKLQASQLSLDLYSPFPFPNRAQRQLDDFQRAAWDHLVEDPEGVFSRIEITGAQTVVRVAVADRMTHQTCVDCHNSHPRTPRKGWQLDDVRGVLEVTTDISSEVRSGINLSHRLLAGGGIASLCIITICLIVGGRISLLIRELTRSILDLEEGDYNEPLNLVARRDEIGYLATNFATMTERLIDREQSLKEINEGLELRVSERTQELERQTKDLEKALEMSSPVTQIFSDTLLLPIVGFLDAERARDVMSRSLKRIVETKARFFIIDISGVAAIDSVVAKILINIASAVKLMGCECTLSGISPEVATQMIDLGVDLSSIVTTASLEKVLSRTLARKLTI